ncbi:MAG: dihydrodipicolinate synthase family protein [Chloroflexi bacterium]|nr:dihydrodipicolinate synthase family protein [Chloroflexota bacterium]
MTSLASPGPPEPARPRYRRTILGTCCVPWNEDGTLAEELFRASVRLLVRGGVRDLYIFGTAGEGYAVSDTLFDRIARAFVEEMRHLGAPPMVGVISLSLGTVIERIERAAALGVRAFQISLLSWGALSDVEVPIFFHEVCNRFPDLQFLHYNLPRAGRLLTGRQYADLAAAHPNLVAIKYGGSDLRLITDLLLEAPQLRHFFTEFGFIAASAVGEPGFLVSFASSNLARARELYEAGVRRNAPRLAEFQRQLAALRAELAAAVGPGPHMDGAFDKLFSKLHDPRFPLRLLPPYQGASDDAFERYREVLRSRFPTWLTARQEQELGA